MHLISQHWWEFLTGFGSLFLGWLVSVWTGLFKRIWPIREKWKAESSYSTKTIENNPHRAIEGIEWIGSEPQKERQWFSVDFAKPRLISDIIIHPGKDRIEAPKHWQIEFFSKNHNVPISTIDGFKLVIHLGKKELPPKIQSFKIHIIEPMDDLDEEMKNSNHALRYGLKRYWTISQIKVKEYIFSVHGFRFWRHNI